MYLCLAISSGAFIYVGLEADLRVSIDLRSVEDLRISINAGISESPRLAALKGSGPYLC